jgi:hypothetical protein
VKNHPYKERFTRARRYSHRCVGVIADGEENGLLRTALLKGAVDSNEAAAPPKAPREGKEGETKKRRNCALAIVVKSDNCQCRHQGSVKAGLLCVLAAADSCGGRCLHFQSEDVRGTAMLTTMSIYQRFDKANVEKLLHFLGLHLQDNSKVLDNVVV